MITLRNLEEKDFNWFYKECEVFASYYSTKKSLLGEKEYVRQVLNNISQNHIFLFAEDSKLGLLGCMAAILTPHLFNPEIITMTIIYWWVAEKNRNSRAAYMLLKEFIRLGKQKADWIIFGINISSPIKDSTIRKLGFIPHEKSYLIETGGA